MDGSAAPFVFLIECAGVAAQSSPRRALRILSEVAVSEPHRSASLAPGGGFTVGFEIDFAGTAIGRQEWFTEVSESARSEEHTSELQSLMRISYAVFCLKKKNTTTKSDMHEILRLDIQ